jgi:1-acyl-sn-glycerol-3-phosphate acyltransferase
MRILLSSLFWFCAVTGSMLAFGVASAIWLVSAPFDPHRRLNHLWSCVWGSAYAYGYPGLRIRTEHRDRIGPGAHVLVANHTSLADTVFCLTLFRQFKWVAKRETLRIPFIGWNLPLCRYITVQRGNTESITKMMEACRYWLRQGISLMMFPEGTRSTDGRLLPFKQGPFKLALEAGVSVIPVAIHGAYQLLPKNGALLETNVDIVVEVLEPLPCTDFKDPDALAAATRGALEQALARGPALGPARGVSGAPIGTATR